VSSRFGLAKEHGLDPNYWEVKSTAGDRGLRLLRVKPDGHSARWNLAGSHEDLRVWRRGNRGGRGSKIRGDPESVAPVDEKIRTQAIRVSSGGRVDAAQERPFQIAIQRSSMMARRSMDIIVIGRDFADYRLPRSSSSANAMTLSPVTALPKKPPPVAVITTYCRPSRPW